MPKLFGSENVIPPNPNNSSMFMQNEYTIREAAEADMRDKYERAEKKKAQEENDKVELEYNKYKSKAEKEIAALRKENVKLKDKEKRALAEKKLQVKKDKDKDK